MEVVDDKKAERGGGVGAFVSPERSARKAKGKFFSMEVVDDKKAKRDRGSGAFVSPERSARVAKKKGATCTPPFSFREWFLFVLSVTSSNNNVRVVLDFLAAFGKSEFDCSACAVNISIELKVASHFLWLTCV